MRDRRAVASDAGLTGAPDESGARRREQGLARAGNARVRRGMIQLAWRFLMFQRESTDGPTAADARNVMVEGASGILAISPDRERPLYEPSKRRLTWPNGAVATTYSADEPERLRGPQHEAGWCNELAAWRYPEAWDMLMFGMRLGADRAHR